MDKPRWREVADDARARPWELFHHNSRITGHDALVDPAADAARIEALHESLPHELWAAHPLPPFEAVRAALGPVDLVATMAGRRSPREGFARRTVSEAVLSAILHLSYGITHDERAAGYPRPFRAVPSGGALYPLELYVLAGSVEGVAPGLHHYAPPTHALYRRPGADPTATLAAAFVQPAMVEEAAFTILLTALPERSSAKYGERGYRFALIEAGHVAQNAVLGADGFGLSAQVLGGFFDEALDAALGLDGLAHTTLYAVAVGGRRAS